MRRRTLDHLVPGGTNAVNLKKKLIVLLFAVAALSVLLFTWRLHETIQALYSYGTHFLRDAQMPDFVVLLRSPQGALGIPVFSFVYLLVIGMVFLAGMNYAAHWQGSRSIDFMRRLPDRWELHRRCLTLPLLTIAACVAIILVLTPFLFWLYLRFTPAECLRPDQWDKLLRQFPSLFFPIFYPTFSA